jgi:hypothetical protein
MIFAMSIKPPLPSGHVSMQMFLRLLTLAFLAMHDVWLGFSWYSFSIGLLVIVGAWLEWRDETVSALWVEARIRRLRGRGTPASVEPDSPAP